MTGWPSPVQPLFERTPPAADRQRRIVGHESALLRLAGSVADLDPPNSISVAVPISLRDQTTIRLFNINGGGLVINRRRRRRSSIDGSTTRNRATEKDPAKDAAGDAGGYPAVVRLCHWWNRKDPTRDHGYCNNRRDRLSHLPLPASHIPAQYIVIDQRRLKASHLPYCEVI